MDRIKTVIQFKQIIWTCPECRQEDIVDASMDGGNVYEHDCSVCGQHFNGPIGRPGRLEYTGNVSLSPEEHAVADAKAISAKKAEVVGKWFAEFKNPPKAVEPTAADLEAEQAEYVKRVEELAPRIKACADYQPPSPEKLKQMRADMAAKLTALELEIAERPELLEFIEDLEAAAAETHAKAGRMDALAEKIREPK